MSTATMRDYHALWYYLANYAGLAALIGGTGTDARLYYEVIPEGEIVFPFVVFEKAGPEERGDTFANTPSTFQIVRYRFVCFAETDPADADEIHDQINAAFTDVSDKTLTGWIGSVTPSTGVKVLACTFLGSSPGHEATYEPETVVFTTTGEYEFILEV